MSFVDAQSRTEPTLEVVVFLADVQNESMLRMRCYGLTAGLLLRSFDDRGEHRRGLAVGTS